MIRYLGRLVGVLLGLPGGPLGVGFGLILGYLTDLILEDTRIRKDARSLTDAAIRDPVRLYVVVAACVIKATAGTRLSSEERAAAATLIFEQAPCALSRRRADRTLRVVESMPRDTDCDWQLIGRALAEPVAKTITGQIAERVFHACRPLATDPGRWARLVTVAHSIGLPVEWTQSLRPEQLLDREACLMLGVSPDVTMRELQRTYRKLAAQFHPDTAGSLTAEQRQTAESAFVRIREAYDLLRSQLSAEYPGVSTEPSPAGD